MFHSMYYGRHSIKIWGVCLSLPESTKDSLAVAAQGFFIVFPVHIPILRPYVFTPIAGFLLFWSAPKAESIIISHLLHNDF